MSPGRQEAGLPIMPPKSHLFKYCKHLEAQTVPAHKLRSKQRLLSVGMVVFVKGAVLVQTFS